MFSFFIIFIFSFYLFFLFLFLLYVLFAGIHKITTLSNMSRESPTSAPNFQKDTNKKLIDAGSSFQRSDGLLAMLGTVGGNIATTTTTSF